MHVRIYRPTEFQVQPWKNGLGVTTELLRLPAGAEDYLLRVSVAKVQSSGPFSLFRGYDRTIIQLTGRPMMLTHEGGQPHVLRLEEPHHFSGDERTECVVVDSAEDYNIIYRRDILMTRTEVRALAPGQSYALAPEIRQAAIFCLAGEIAPGGAGRGGAATRGELLHVSSETQLSELTAGDSPTKVIVTCWTFN